MDLKQLGRRFLTKNPDLVRPLWRRIYPLVRKNERYAGTEYAGSRADAFTRIYRENRWGNRESISGSGSTIEATGMLQRALGAAIRRTGATKILDAPCGDLNWMKHIRLPGGTQYIGADIVGELIANLQRENENPTRSFRVLDIVTDALPTADIWLCRHVLMHLSNADVLKVLANLASSSIGYFLADNYDFVRANKDVHSGGYRFVNLRREPFNLPKPIAEYPNSNPPSPPDYLCLWSRDQIREIVERP